MNGRIRLPHLSALLLVTLAWTAFRFSSAPEDLPKIDAPPGFVVEHLYSPMTADSSSWVALAVDDAGRLFASSQYGALYRITPPAIGADPASTHVEQLDLEIGHANGLLWAYNSLYVLVNSEKGVGGRSSGLYRVSDSDGDDELDSVQLLRGLEGAGEHGPHALVLSPDGRSIYLVAGNYTKLPAPFTSRVPSGWQEDGLVPAIGDPRGHAVDRKAPGGWIARTDSAGSFMELVSVGFRNTFDIGFDAEGELFAFDSDMEWDLGMPWYRQIRFLHVTSGSDFGWRTGSGKWPDYYPDTLPPAVELGQGSPTGVVVPVGADFPVRYQRGMFAFDWSFGTIYWVELEQEGASYRGRAEEFLTGVPLPLTDGVIGRDGALYFATGGRDLDSHLYRVYYAGDEATASTPARQTASPDRTLRRELEVFHGGQHADAEGIAWTHLNHPDRFVRYAARVALEHQPVESWAQRVFAETDPVRRLQGAVALARQATPSLQPQLLDMLAEIEFQALNEGGKLDLLRAYGLAFIRMGQPNEAQRERVGAILAAHYPADTEPLNRELSRLLAYVEAPGAIATTLDLLESYDDAPSEMALVSESVIARSEDYGPAIARMRENAPHPQQIAYALDLSHVRSGWTRSDRERYFRWFYDALTRSGGESYKGFLEYIRSDAIDNLPPEEREALADLTGSFPARQSNLVDLPQPEGPGRTWNKHGVAKLVHEELERGPRDFERGRRMYAAALCASCHVMAGEGSIVGPDLTQVGTRFSRDDLIEAILSPSRSISDQYAATLLTLRDGSTLVGRIVEENDAELTMNQNPFDPYQTVRVAKADVESREPSPVSIMPPRMMDRLNETEVLDLMAFLLSGADPEHALFRESD